MSLQPRGPAPTPSSQGALERQLEGGSERTSTGLVLWQPPAWHLGWAELLGRENKHPVGKPRHPAGPGEPRLSQRAPRDLSQATQLFPPLPYNGDSACLMGQS